ncbi:MAG: hypothetical protein H7070_05860 [Saprospiraceae bacterium]|nr:hypothetical protein [Pyrinomonadaceae bacterium]
MKGDRKNNHGTEWPDSLDAVIAAPDHHNVIFENENIRVLDACIPPGATVPLHSHRWPSVVYTLTTNDFLRYDRHGNVVLDSRLADIEIKPGTAISLPPLHPHSIKNIGDGEIRAISVEIKK